MFPSVSLVIQCEAIETHYITLHYITWEALETHGLEAKVKSIIAWFLVGRRGEFGPSSIKVMISPENKQRFAPRLHWTRTRWKMHWEALHLKYVVQQFWVQHYRLVLLIIRHCLKSLISKRIERLWLRLSLTRMVCSNNDVIKKTSTQFHMCVTVTVTVEPFSHKSTVCSCIN